MEKAKKIGSDIVNKVNDIANNMSKMKINVPRNQTEEELKKSSLNSQVLFFIIFLIGIIFIGALILVSKVFRIYLTLSRLAIYKTNQIKQINVSDIVGLEIDGEKPLLLRDFYIASAYRPYVCHLHKFDYVSVEVFSEVLKCGPRFVELEIFNSKYGVDVEPVVSIGEEKGEWKYTLNSINLKLFLKEIAKNVFNLKETKVYKDPFILLLNLKTNRNIRCLNKIHKYIYEILGEYLLDSKFAYNSKNNNDINNISIKECLGKVVIFSTTGFEDSNLEEVVNYSTVSNYTLQNNKDQYRILYVRQDDVVDTDEDINDYSNEQFHKIAGNDLMEYNKCGFTILSPEIKTDSFFGGISPINYDPGKGLEWGCQFIMMNYQKIDTNMSNYAYIFKDSSFVLKSDIYRNKDISQCKKYFTGEKLVYENKEQKEINYIYTKT